MDHADSVRSPFDRVPFAIRALIAGALALSMMFVSLAVALTLLAYAAGVAPGRLAGLSRPARVVVMGVHMHPRNSAARLRTTLQAGAEIPCSAGKAETICGM
jgi:hypothetical protein